MSISTVYRGGIDYGVTRAAQYRFLQEHSESFESLEANDVVASGVNLSGGSEPEQVPGAFVSAGFFGVIGVIPTLGRAFTEDEDRSGSTCVVMLTDGLWRRRYIGESSILARTITVNGESCAVIGVLPPSFRFHVNAEILMPIRIASAPRDLGHYYSLLARLKPGVTLEKARAELQTLFSRFRAAHGDLVDQDEVGFQVGRYLDGIVGNVRPALWALFAAVVVVVLIACVNVANLQLFPRGTPCQGDGGAHCSWSGADTVGPAVGYGEFATGTDKRSLRPIVGTMGHSNVAPSVAKWTSACRRHFAGLPSGRVCVPDIDIYRSGVRRCTGTVRARCGCECLA